MILDKILKPNTYLSCEDLTSNQKNILWEVMREFEAKQGFSYCRFFQKGFLPWELKGIDQLKRDFIHENVDRLFPSFSGQDVESEIERVLDTPGEFYRTLGRRYGTKTEFHRYMMEHGMSVTTCIKRFSSDDWALFEREGIRHVAGVFERRLSSSA